jgi:HPt (histidine-containing phosphotransfer) domain-containing protein
MSAFEIAPLLELFDDDRIEVANLLSTAARSVSGDVALVVSSNDAHDARELRERAHRIKGTSGSIGAHALREAAASLEGAARNESWAAIPSLVETLRSAASELTSEISRYCTEATKGRTT